MTFSSKCQMSALASDHFLHSAAPRQRREGQHQKSPRPPSTNSFHSCLYRWCIMHCTLERYHRPNTHVRLQLLRRMSLPVASCFHPNNLHLWDHACWSRNSARHTAHQMSLLGNWMSKDTQRFTIFDLSQSTSYLLEGYDVEMSLSYRMGFHFGLGNCEVLELLKTVCN